jgi:hypothetical protein
MRFLLLNFIEYSFFFQVNDEYMRNLQLLSTKLRFLAEDPVAKLSAAYKDVEPELEKLRLKAIYKVSISLFYLKSY